MINQPKITDSEILEKMISGLEDATGKPIKIKNRLNELAANCLGNGRNGAAAALQLAVDILQREGLLPE